MAETFPRPLAALLIFCSSLSALFGCGGGASYSAAPPPPSATAALTAAVAALGNFSSGETNATYTITVSNSGNGATTGTVTVTDPPTGFTITGISGSGWTCTLTSTTCTRSDSLAAGASFPAITVTGTVTGTVGQTVNIPISISGGGTTTTTNSPGSVAIAATIGGTISGVSGTGLVLQDNGGNNLSVSPGATAFTFTTDIANGGSYNVTVLSQPSSPSQTCVVTNGSGSVTNANVTGIRVSCTTNTYTIAGTVSGLLGTGLVLQDNGGNNLPITANGAFTFTTAIANGGSFNVTVFSHPTSPSQTCVVTNGSGAVTNANITGVQVACTTNTYTIGGMVSGLSGTGLVLQDNGGSNLPVTANGAFTFTTAIASGGNYSVTIVSQPSSPSQTCVVTSGSGTVTNANITGVQVACTTGAYTIGGVVSGLSGAGLVLQDNGGNNLPVAANGAFTFTTPIASGSSYSVTVLSQPSSPLQICVVTSGSGSVTNANITGVRVACTTNTYTIGGTVSGLSGTGLVLQDNGGNNLSISPGATTFTFATTIASGGSYSVTVLSQPSSPSQTCVVTNGSGAVTNANITGVQVACTAPSPDFSISVSPSSPSTEAGTTSAPVTVSVTGLNGFSGSVSVTVSGLPTGIVPSPASPLSINANSSAQLSFIVPASASTATSALVLQATAGALTHTAGLSLTVTTSLHGFWNLTQGSSLVQQNPAPVGSHFTVGGWAFEKIPLTSVSVLIDNSPIGNAFYGAARPDIPAGVPGAPTNCGFSLGVDTTNLSNGLHTISVNVTDSANNVAALESYPFFTMTVQINVNNPAPAPTGPVANLTLGAPTTSLAVGTIVQYTASATNGSGQPVSPSFTWNSSAPSIVKVTPRGVVLPLAAGNATISVSAGGQTQQLAVTVQAGSGTPGSIHVSLGPEEIVYKYDTDSCMDGDYPDSEAHAVRFADGSLMLSAGHDQFWFSDFGKDFYSLKRVCSPQMISVDDYHASSFANRQWIFSLYNDGSVIHALIHNEFHDPIAPGCKPGDSSDGNPCLYNSITYASSTDGGHTFKMLPAPQNVVAAPPVQWTPPALGSPSLSYGYQQPLNIVHAADGFYYSRFGEFPPPGQPYFGGNCVMRTATLSDPSSWRAWNGTSFGLAMTDPYTGPSAPLCATTTATVPFESLGFNTYLNMFMLVGADSDFSSSGPINCGFHFSLSSDLVNWSPQQFIAPAYLAGSGGCGKPQPGPLAGALAYVSMIDHDDPSTNFETPGRTPYFYYTRFNDNMSDRDLIRVPVIITKY